MGTGVGTGTPQGGSGSKGGSLGFMVASSEVGGSCARNNPAIEWCRRCRNEKDHSKHDPPALNTKSIPIGEAFRSCHGGVLLAWLLLDASPDCLTRDRQRGFTCVVSSDDQRARAEPAPRRATRAADRRPASHRGVLSESSE